MASKPKSLHFTPTTTSCYICGKSLDEFKTYFNFALHHAEYAARTGIAGKEAEKVLVQNYNQFVDHYSAPFFKFYKQFMQFPAALDTMPYRTIKLEREQHTVQKTFPELRGFDYSQLKTWGMTQIPSKRCWINAMQKGEGNTIGDFKVYCTELAYDFKNKVMNRGIIWIINQWYGDQENVDADADADGYPVDKPAFLRSLIKNLQKLEEVIQSQQPEIEFSEKKYTQTIKNQETITFTYHLCPVCRHIVGGCE